MSKGSPIVRAEVMSWMADVKKNRENIARQPN